MVLNYNKNECCGCTACYNICPTSAISMKKDLEGFFVPVINQAVCIDCGKCIQVCGFKQKNNNTVNNQIVYAVKRKNVLKRKQSQSGGAFSSIAEFFLEENSVVYGVLMNESLEAVYTKISSKNNLIKLQGSKYIQASMGTIYSEVEEDLKDRKTVLFGGTACHVDGLLHYLKIKKIDMSLLFTYDFVCHGVPSPKLFNDYIDLTQKEYHSKVNAFNFRDKMFGWHGHKTSMILNNHKNKVISINFVNIFYSNLGLRSSCYKCPYASKNRISDFTVGDFWGIEKNHPEFDDNKGCSLLILNTEKSKKIFQKIKNNFEYIESSIEECLQPNLVHPTVCPDGREQFWKEYHHKGFEYVAKKYCQYNIKKDYSYSVKNRVNKYIKKITYTIINFIKKNKK